MDRGGRPGRCTSTSASLKPDIIINNRVGKGRKGMEGLSKTDRAYAGDFGTPEQQIPANGLPGRRLGKLHDDERHVGLQVVRRRTGSRPRRWSATWSTSRRRAATTCSTSARRPRERFPAPSVERLAAMGRWMKVNGEAIYGTTASPFATQLPLGRATRKGASCTCTSSTGPSSGTLELPSAQRTVNPASPSPAAAPAPSKSADGFVD